jgi:transcriptional regulator with XRE-family HTH domain
MLVRKELKGDPDYAYGRLMLTLRTTIGLTQKRLANHLGISRRAVGEWEAGNSYPSVEHLKALIGLAVRNQAFAAGHEVEEIRLLWKVARQKVLLDEHWLCTLLDEQCSSRPYVMSTAGAAEFASGERTSEEPFQVHINLTILISKNEV